MGSVAILTALREVLESNGFPSEVFEFGYRDLRPGTSGTVIIMKLNGLSLEDIDAYGPSYLRTWQVLLETYSHMDDPRTAHQRLADSIDTIITAIEQYPYLGLGEDSAIQAAKIQSVAPVVTESNEQGTVSWLRANVIVTVQELSSVIEQE